MTGGEIFLLAFIIYMLSILFENSQKHKFIKDMAQKGYEEKLTIVKDHEGKNEIKRCWVKSKD